MSVSVEEKVEELKKLTTADKLEVIGDLWDSIPAEEMVADSATLDELERRCAEIDRNPDRLVSFDQFLAALRRE